MTKEQTNFFKGLALLMMLFVHVNSASLSSVMEFGGRSIWSFFNHANTPVVLFLILSGYGFYAVSQKESDGNYFFRVVKLFLHFWVILLIMLPLTYAKNIFDVSTIVDNISGWHVSWNETCWFIFPYAFLALSYKRIYKMGSKVGWIKLAICSSLLYFVAGFLVSRNAVTYHFSTPIVYNTLYLFMSQFPFVLGMALNKYSSLILNVESDQRNKRLKKIFGGALFLLLIVTKLLLLRTTMFDAIYAFLLIVFVSWSFPCRNSLFETLGKHSLNIWMVHAFLLPHMYKYQHDLLFMTALIIYSYILSVLVNVITSPLEELIQHRMKLVK